MPIYEYECSNGHRFEERRNIADRFNVECPECGEPVTIRISTPSVRITNPVRWIAPDGSTIKELPDGGIAPKVGQPYPVGG